ncbi:MAG: hypothetical protein AB7P94_17345 [Steroidobacteraceae bacterium]
MPDNADALTKLMKLKELIQLRDSMNAQQDQQSTQPPQQFSQAPQRQFPQQNQGVSLPFPVAQGQVPSLPQLAQQQNIPRPQNSGTLQRPIQLPQQQPTVFTNGTFAGANISNLPGKAADIINTDVAKNQAQNISEGDFLNQITDLGKPLGQVNFEDVLKASNGNITFSKKFIDLRKAFETGSSPIKSSVGIVNSLISLADNIPSSSGFVGKQLTSRANNVREEFGQLPDREVFFKMVKLSAPMVRKALGDSGNQGEKETAQAIDAIELLASPQSETRKIGRKTLEEIFSNVLGETITFKSEKNKKITSSFGAFASPDGRIFEARTKKEADELKAAGAKKLEF